MLQNLPMFSKKILYKMYHRLCISKCKSLWHQVLTFFFLFFLVGAVYCSFWIFFVKYRKHNYIIFKGIFAFQHFCTEDFYTVPYCMCIRCVWVLHSYTTLQTDHVISLTKKKQHELEPLWTYSDLHWDLLQTSWLNNWFRAECFGFNWFFSLTPSRLL